MLNVSLHCLQMVGALLSYVTLLIQFELADPKMQS